MLKLDELDHRLLTELRTDSRRSIRQLAKSLKESPSTIYNRVKRLETKEIIKKWTISLDYDLLNLDTTAFIFISIRQTEGSDTLKQIGEKLKGVTGVFEVHHVSGEFDVLLKIRSDTMRSVGKIVMEEIRPIPEIDRTVTSTCFETVLQECDVIEIRNGII